MVPQITCREAPQEHARSTPPHVRLADNLATEPAQPQDLLDKEVQGHAFAD